MVQFCEDKIIGVLPKAAAKNYAVKLIKIFCNYYIFIN